MNIGAFGGKAAHYSVLRRTPGVPIQKAFGVPVYYYDQFMRTNGLYARLDELLAEAGLGDKVTITQPTGAP